MRSFPTALFIDVGVYMKMEEAKRKKNKTVPFSNIYK